MSWELKIPVLTFNLAVQPMPNANKHHMSCLLGTPGLPKLNTSSVTCAGRTVSTPAETKLILYRIYTKQHLCAVAVH